MSDAPEGALPPAGDAPPPGYLPPPSPLPGYGTPPPPPAYGQPPSLPPPGYDSPAGYGAPQPPGYGPPGYGAPPPPRYGAPPPGYGYGPSPGYGPPPPGYGYGPSPGYGPPPPGYGGIPSWLPQPTGGSARTGPLPLHPMSVGDILDGAFKLLRANARSMVLVVATFMVPVSVLTGYLQRNNLGGRGIFTAISNPASASNQTDPATTFAVLAIQILVYWFVVPVICGGVSRIVMVSYTGGQLPAKEAIKAAARRAPALLVATLIVHLSELPGLVLCLVPALFIVPFFVMTAPAIAIEELGPIAGVGRAISLGRRRYWPTMGIALLAGLIASVMGQVLAIGPGAVALAIGMKYGWVLVSATNILVAFVTIPLTTIVATLLYLDARIRSEGFDLQLVAARLER